MKGVLIVLAALKLSSPHMSQSTRLMYAKIITEESARINIDPLVPVSLFEHESHWISSADNGKCVGLGQVCLETTQRACKAGLDTPACQARRVQLFDGPTNIRTSIRMLGLWKKRCLELTGRIDLRHVIGGYAGVDGTCRKPEHPLTRDILDIYKKLKHPTSHRHKKRKSK